jgi:hypothetical protein
MTEPRPWDILEAKTRAFERLVNEGCCPPPGEMLLAVAAEFRPVDAAGASFRLDEQARELFDAAAARDGEGAGACRAARLRARLLVGRHE